MRWLVVFEPSEAARRESAALRERCAGLATSSDGIGALLSAGAVGALQDVHVGDVASKVQNGRNG